jgi:UDP-glucose 4-epimerase
MGKIQKRIVYDNFNIGTGQSVKIDSLFKLIKKKIGKNPKIKRKKLEKYDPIKSYGTYSKMKNFLNLKNYKFTKIEDGLENTINDMKIRFY